MWREKKICEARALKLRRQETIGEARVQGLRRKKRMARVTRTLALNAPAEIEKRESDGLRALRRSVVESVSTKGGDASRPFRRKRRAS